MGCNSHIPCAAVTRETTNKKKDHRLLSAGCARNPSRLRDRSLLSFGLNAEVAEAQRLAEKGRTRL